MANPNVITRDTVSLLPDRLLNVEEAAQILHCCRATVRREANRGHLRGQKVGQCWRFAPEDLLRYLDLESTRALSAPKTRQPEWLAYIEEVVGRLRRCAADQIAKLSVLFDYQPGQGGATMTANEVGGGPQDITPEGADITPSPPRSRRRY